MPLKKIGPQAWFPIKWKLYVRIVERDPHLFAQALNSLDYYTVVINYHTIRIDGESPQIQVVIRGDFQEFRQKVIKHWKGRHEDLAQLVKSPRGDLSDS